MDGSKYAARRTVGHLGPTEPLDGALLSTRPILVTALAWGFALPLAGGAQPEPNPPIRAEPALGTIEVDGRLDEPDWARAEHFEDFVQSFPDEGGADGAPGVGAGEEEVEAEGHEDRHPQHRRPVQGDEDPEEGERPGGVGGADGLVVPGEGQVGDVEQEQPEAEEEQERGRAAGRAEPEPHPPIQALRATGPIRTDGRLDEPDWARAEPFSDFVQSFPDEGAPPTQRTEVRVLYDARTLYVGIRCYDTEHTRIVRPLGRRDKIVGADAVAVFVDPNRDGRTGAMFYVSAGRVLADALIYDDEQQSLDWDAVWEGAAAILSDGWSAELAIPFSALRFPEAPVQTWGFGVQREIGRSHEKSATVLLPRAGRGLMSRLGHLTGIEDIRPGLDLEVTPYAAARVALQPLHRDVYTPDPRVWNPSADLGADLNMRLGSRLTLTGAVNPDFGQVEADEIILNLTGFETYFPEKRPFFTQGLDLFQPVGAGFEQQVPHQMFYSRRIGLDAPILGAAKLVGRVSDRVQLGLLDAVTTGTGTRGGAGYPDTPHAEDAAGRGPRWSWSQPFRIAPERAYPVVAPATVNHLAGVLRLEAAERVSVGLQGTSAHALGKRCRLSAADLDLLSDAAADNQRPGVCDAPQGQALALDVNATTAGGEWYLYGQGSASRADGPTERILADGTSLRPGDLGLGAYLRAGRRGGEPWRLDLGWSWSSPRHDLDASGYQRTQNEQEAKATLKFFRPNGGGLFHEWTALAGGYGRYTIDGRGLPRGRGAFLGVDARLKAPYLWLEWRVYWDEVQYDVRAIALTGIPLRRPGAVGSGLYFATDEARPVWLEGWAGASKNTPFPPAGAPWEPGLYLATGLRPHPRLETRLGLNYDPGRWAIRYVGDLGPDPYRPVCPAGTCTYPFAALRAPSLSLVLRQLVVITPRLTFQVYGQLLTASGRYGPFWQASRPLGDRTPIERSDLLPAPTDSSADFHDSRLVVDAVLRWEWRLGSILYVVYARDQAELPWDAVLPASAPRSLAPRLTRGPTTDSFLVKWSWWFPI